MGNDINDVIYAFNGIESPVVVTTAKEGEEWREKSCYFLFFLPFKPKSDQSIHIKYTYKLCLQNVL